MSPDPLLAVGSGDETIIARTLLSGMCAHEVSQSTNDSNMAIVIFNPSYSAAGTCAIHQSLICAWPAVAVPLVVMLVG